MGKASVELIEQPLSEAILQKEQWIEMMITVSSLRIDTIISAYLSNIKAKITSVNSIWSCKSKLDSN